MYEASLVTPLDADQQRVVELTYNGFAMRSAELSSEKKARYAAIDKELSSLYNTFSDNVLHDEENYVTYLKEDQLDGLSEGFIKSVIFSVKNNNEKKFLNSFKENIIWGGAGSLIDIDFRDAKMNQKKRIVLKKLRDYRKEIRKPFWKFWF